MEGRRFAATTDCLATLPLCTCCSISLAAVAAELEPFFAEDAKRRQKLSIKARDEKGRAAPVMEKIPEVVQEKPASVARNEAAKSVGVNDRYVQDAKKIKTEAPEVFERLKAGKMTLQDAKREVAKKPTDDWRKDERERQAKRLCCMMPRLHPELPPQTSHQFCRISCNLQLWRRQCGFENAFIVPNVDDRPVFGEPIFRHHQPIQFPNIPVQGQYQSG